MTQTTADMVAEGLSGEGENMVTRVIMTFDMDDAELAMTNNQYLRTCGLEPQEVQARILGALAEARTTSGFCSVNDVIWQAYDDIMRAVAQAVETEVRKERGE